RRLDGLVAGAVALGVLAAALPLVFSATDPMPGWPSLLADAVVVCGMSVVAAVGGLDVRQRGDGRSLPVVAAAAAIGVLWMAHLVAVAGALSPAAWMAGAPMASAQTAELLFALAHAGTPAC